jgi:hypothetical protein
MRYANVRDDATKEPLEKAAQAADDLLAIGEADARRPRRLSKQARWAAMAVLIGVPLVFIARRLARRDEPAEAAD